MTPGIPAALLMMLQTSGGGSTLTPLLFQFGLIFLIFYFLIIRPQQRQRKGHEESLRNLKRGDRIVTTGGIIAEVVHIKQGEKDGKSSPTMDDEVTIRSGESRLIVERGRIAKILAASGAVSVAPRDAKAEGKAAT